MCVKLFICFIVLIYSNALCARNWKSLRLPQTTTTACLLNSWTSYSQLQAWGRYTLVYSFAQYSFYHLPPQLSTFALMIAFLWVVYIVLKLHRFCAFFTGTVVGVATCSVLALLGRVHKWLSFYLKWSVEMLDLVLVYCVVILHASFNCSIAVPCNCVVSKCPSACILPCDTSTL